MNDEHRILTALEQDINLNRAGAGALEELAGQGHLAEFERGEYIFCSGDDTDKVYVVERGKVILSREDPSGKAFTFLVAVRGIPLSAVSCFMEGPRTFSARVVEQASVVVFRSRIFKDWVVDHPPVMVGILETLGTLLDGTYTRILDLIGQSAETRILNALNMLSRKMGAHLPLTNEDVAEMTGVSRETAARIISQLQKLDLIVKSRGAIEILDMARLQELCTSPFFIL